MKKYEYVSVKVGSLIGGSGNLEHRAIIDKCSQNGYAYIGYIPTHMDSYRRLKTID